MADHAYRDTHSNVFPHRVFGISASRKLGVTDFYDISVEVVSFSIPASYLPVKCFNDFNLIIETALFNKGNPSALYREVVSPKRSPSGTPRSVYEPGVRRHGVK